MLVSYADFADYDKDFPNHEEAFDSKVFLDFEPDFVYDLFEEQDTNPEFLKAMDYFSLAKLIINNGWHWLLYSLIKILFSQLKLAIFRN